MRLFILVCYVLIVTVNLIVSPERMNSSQLPRVRPELILMQI
jgi:hypothetical protein